MPVTEGMHFAVAAKGGTDNSDNNWNLNTYTDILVLGHSTG